VASTPDRAEPLSRLEATRLSARARGASPRPDLPQLEDLPQVEGRRVLVRCDFNVPLRRGRIIDDTRIRAATPTLEWLVRRGAHVTVCTHLGRPSGRRDTRFDLGPVRDHLADLVPQVELMENLRFHAGEEANDPAFVERLLDGQDLYVNDAFATAHRKHASVVGPPARLPSAAGRLLSREVEVLSALRCQPRRPFVAVLGGNDPEMITGVRLLMEFVDTVVLGGPTAFAALGGADLSVSGQVDEWADLIEAGRLLLPPDLLVVRDDDPSEVRLAGVAPPGWHAVDIGQRSAGRFASVIAGAGTVFWDGAMGEPGHERGTRAVAEAVAESPAFTVVSGVDTLEVLGRLRLSAFVNHVSTGGAATLAFLRDGDLPGLEAIRRYWSR
jgi:phosphoglycerate kinase